MELGGAHGVYVSCESGALINQRGNTMSKLAGLGIASAMVLALGFGAGSAQAFVAKPFGIGTSMDLATPAAMCGRSCRGGGRYIPGPPSVCEANGLNYCGSSRGGGGGGVGVVVPGTGIGVGVGPGGGGVYVAPGGNCRTITIQRDDGSVRRVRRCD